MNNSKIYNIFTNNQNSLLFYQIFIFLIVFFLSYYLIPQLKSPDTIFYKILFEQIDSFGFNLTDAFNYYQSQIASKEIIHFFLIWLSNILNLEYSLFISLVNGILAVVVCSLMFQYINPSIILVMIIISNNYLFNLFFILERLKFSILFLALAIYFFRKVMLRYLFIFFALLSHFSILMLMLVYFYEYILCIKNYYIRVKNFKISLNFFTLLVVFFFVVINSDHFLIKFNQIILISLYSYDISQYYDVFFKSIVSSFKMLIFLFLSLYVNQKKTLNIYYQFLFLTLFAFFFEPSRIVLFGYLIFLFYNFSNKDIKKRRLVFIITSLYFSLKTFVLLW